MGTIEWVEVGVKCSKECKSGRQQSNSFLQALLGKLSRIGQSMWDKDL